jgi:hypothetical protein
MTTRPVKRHAKHDTRYVTRQPARSFHGEAVLADATAYIPALSKPGFHTGQNLGQVRLGDPVVGEPPLFFAGQEAAPLHQP